MPLCTWAGLGTVGCGSTCNVWIQGGYGLQSDTMFHELGHTLGLQHASTPVAEYGDNSSPMGAYPGVRCLGAAHNWQLGWSDPLYVVDPSLLTPGQPLLFTLPPLSTISTNFIRILPNFIGPNGSIPFFVSFRQPVGMDVGLLGTIYVNTVSIHVFNATRGQVGLFIPLLHNINCNTRPLHVDDLFPSSLSLFYTNH